MKVCLLGGAGFIGSRVARCFLNGGHALVCLLRHPEKGVELARLGAHIIPGEIVNPNDLRRAMSGSDVVINLAVPSYRGRMSLRRVQGIAQEFMRNVQNILGESERAGGLPVIMSEGTFIWGDSGNGQHDEKSAFKPMGMGRIGELSTPHVQKMIKERGAPVIRMIAAGVYGAGGWFEFAMYDLMKKGWYTTIGNGQNVTSLVYVDDLAEAYRLAAEKLPLRESFVIADDYPVKFRDFANSLAHAMGKPPVKSMPKWIGNIVVGKVWVEELTMTHRVRNTKAKEKLGWHPKHASYEQGIPEAVKQLEKKR